MCTPVQIDKSNAWLAFFHIPMHFRMFIASAVARGAAVDRQTPTHAVNAREIARRRLGKRQRNRHLLACSAAGPNLGGLGPAALASLDVCHDSHTPIERVSAATRGGRQRCIWRGVPSRWDWASQTRTTRQKERVSWMWDG